MKEFKVRQLVYNKTTVFDDDLSNIAHSIIQEKSEIIRLSVDYFFRPMELVIYPAKSFSVAIIYAHLLQVHFSENFYDSLDSKDLFCGNDRYFETYSSAKEIYDPVLAQIAYRPGFSLDLQLNQIKKTVSYFNAEFSI